MHLTQVQMHFSHFHSDGLFFNVKTRITYTQKEAGEVKKKISLTTKEDIPKNSAIPPHTPNNALSVDDFVSLCIFIPTYMVLFTATIKTL
jgi:hypothetical protein